MRDIINLIEAASRFTKDELETRFGNEFNYSFDERTTAANNDPDDKGDFESCFADGSPTFSCDSWAEQVKSALPANARVYGFWLEDNHVPALENCCDGHTFAVIDGRFIVDGWLKNVEQLSPRAVFDLEDPADAEAIKHFYGNPENWKEES